MRRVERAGIRLRDTCPEPFERRLRGVECGRRGRKVPATRFDLGNERIDVRQIRSQTLFGREVARPSQMLFRAFEIPQPHVNQCAMRVALEFLERLIAQGVDLVEQAERTV
jgi:hypothetical protein